MVGIGANTPAEAIYPTALADSDGALLTGANRYRLVFRRGQLPPVRGFWSLTMYDSDGFLVPNAAQALLARPHAPPLVAPRRRLDRDRDPARRARRSGV